MTLLRRPAADETHVWVVSEALLTSHAAALHSLAGDDSPRALGRGFLRVLLGGYLGVRAAEVPVERRCPACGGPHGPPVAADLRISVSYTDGRVAYAFAMSPVGVDIERLRPRFPWWDVAPLVLSDAALERVRAAPPEQRATAFLQAWTRREAVGKATGLGLLGSPGDGELQVETIADDPYVATVARSTRRLCAYGFRGRPVNVASSPSAQPIDPLLPADVDATLKADQTASADTTQSQCP